MSTIDELLSDESLKENFRESIGQLSDEELKNTLRGMLTDEKLAGIARESVDAMIEDLAATGELSEAELAEEREKLTRTLTSPETLQSMRDQILNNPETIPALRKALENPDAQTLQGIRETIQGSTNFAVLSKIQGAVDNGAIEATFWGGAAIAERAVQLGSQSKIANFFSISGQAGKRIPGVAVIAGLAEGGIGIYQIANGETEKGTINIGGAVGGTVATLAAGAATVGALAAAPAIVPIAVAGAIGVAGYYAGRNIARAGYAIYDTMSTYRQVDAMFQPDRQNHSNLRMAIARVLGNDAMNARLAEAGIPVDGNGKVRMKALSAALIDPQNGQAVENRLRALINEQRNHFDRVMEANETWTPRWIQFTDAQGEKRMRYESANMDRRIMESAQTELDDYQAKLLQAQAEAQATIAEALKPFNALEPEMQDAVTHILEQNYKAYLAQNGDNAMAKDDYMIAKKVEIMSEDNKHMIENLRVAERAIQEVTDIELAQWQEENPSASEEQIADQRLFIVSSLRDESMNSSEAFQQRIARHQQAAAQERQRDQAPEQVAARGADPAQDAAAPAAASSANSSLGVGEGSWLTRLFVAAVSFVFGKGALSNAFASASENPRAQEQVATVEPRRPQGLDL